MNTLFNKVLGENEKCVSYCYFKTEGTFWPAQYIRLNAEAAVLLAECVCVCVYVCTHACVNPEEEFGNPC